LRASEAVRRLLQPLLRGRGLRAAVTRAVCRRAAHGIGRFAKLPRRFAQVAPLLVACELLETARRLLRLVRQPPLPAAAAAAPRRAPPRRAPQPFGFGLLPPRQLLQLFRELVDLAIRALLIGALLHFVLVRQLVELELEQVGEIFGHLVASRSAAAAVA